MDRIETEDRQMIKSQPVGGMEHSVFLDPAIWGWRLLVRVLIVLNVIGFLGVAVISYGTMTKAPVTASSCPPCTHGPTSTVFPYLESLGSERRL